MNPQEEPFVSTSSVREPEAAPVSKWRRRVLLAIAIGLALTCLSFLVYGGWSVLEDRSLDLPGDHVRVGFHRLAWFRRWTCGEGHDHWSAPYWVGLLLLGFPTWAAFRGWLRARSAALVGR